jgi:lysyl-tRNA synthetase class 2
MVKFELERVEKAKRLKDRGINPYANRFKRTHTVTDLAGGKPGRYITIAGRVMRYDRSEKKIILEDITGNIAVEFTNNVDKKSRVILENLDRGDFVGCRIICRKVDGKPHYCSDKVEILCKALFDWPYPEEMTAGQRAKLRGLDIAVNSKSREIFKTRVAFIRNIREYLNRNSMNEIESPILRSWYDIVCFPQFETLDKDNRKLFLRLCHEDRLKILVAGGFEKVYEIGKSFRPGKDNDSHKHLQEFLQLETIQAFTNYFDMMEHAEDLFYTVTKWTTGNHYLISKNGSLIDIKPPWKRISVRDAIKDNTGIDIYKYSDYDRRRVHTDPQGLKREMDKKFSKKTPRESKRANTNNRRSAAPPGDIPASLTLLPREPYDAWYWSLVEHLIGTFVGPQLINPTILFDYPYESNWLVRRVDERPDFCERFEFYIDGTEMANCYSLVNDPIDFEERISLGLDTYCKAFHDEWQSEPVMDEVLMLAKGYGLPPLSESSFGLERWLSMLTGVTNIQDVVWIPFPYA